MPPPARPRMLIIGCGDVGLRVARRATRCWQVMALTSSPQRVPLLRTYGIRPLLGNLDDPESLGRLAGLADAVLHLAPPPAQGEGDPRTRHLLQALARRTPPRVLVYASTTGVYGDAQGERFDETRALNPATARARRRVDAEGQVREFGRRYGCRVALLRIPGIYALDRDGGDPRERVRRGAPVLQPQEDVYTNHIHADDLARACLAAVARAWPMRAVNVCDDTELRMGDYFDLVADLHGLPRPPRLSRSDAGQHLGAMALSFMSESRRLMNRRMKAELALSLRYPTVRQGLLAAPPEG